MTEPTPQPPHFAPSDVFAPEYYADQLQIGTNPWGFVFQYGLASEGGPRPVATVRMSPHHAKVMALLLKRAVLEWEERMGQTLEFPGDLKSELNLPDEL
jgi:hypothetical protein